METADVNRRSWGVMSCPRCGGVVAVEVQVTSSNVGQGAALIPMHSVEEVQSVPESAHRRHHVEHLPDDVNKFFTDAVRVLDAGVPDAAAVQLRRTLEAAAAHKGIRKKTLVQSVKEMIDQQMVTKDFGEVLTHVRRLGNIGAHYSDETLTEDEVHRALRFTTQFLRNVFEVPGELELLKAADATEDGPDPEPGPAVQASGIG
jgi:hypothetical protein